MSEKLTVKELKEIIANLPDDMEVVVQRDSEGNGYRTAYAADPDCVWSDDEETIYSTNLTAQDNGMEEDEWEKMKKEKPRVLVIAP
jgi:hypothetical protein